MPSISNDHNVSTGSNQGMLSKGVFLHRKRPIIEALVWLADQLAMDFVSGELSALAEYGIRGWLVFWQHGAKREGAAGYLKLYKAWFLEDVNSALQMLFVLLLGRRALRWILSGMLNAISFHWRDMLSANDGLYRASDEILQALDPVYAAGVEKARAHREAEKRAAQEQFEQEWENRPPRPDYVIAAMDALIAAYEQARQEQAADLDGATLAEAA